MPTGKLTIILAAHALALAAFALLIARTLWKKGHRARNTILALPVLWIGGAVSLAGNAAIDAQREPLDDLVLGALSVAGGVGGACFVWFLAQTRSHADASLRRALGSGVPAAPGAPSCKRHGNAITGACERCGDFLCPGCTFMTPATKTPLCTACSERLGVALDARIFQRPDPRAEQEL